uniref:Sushi domain-containing protein 5 n=1 Tax=Petromyzon marinus TaxID=7757 RepID=A0AAJ7TCT7_PETMA|nr:sushi domain-containing protein 5 [Petromyzon marinus]
MAGTCCCVLVWLACLGSLSAAFSANGGRVVVAEAAGGMEVSGAEALCASIGSRLSTLAEMSNFVSKCGLLECRPAWLSDGGLRTAGCGNSSEDLQEDVPLPPRPPPPSPQGPVAGVTSRPRGLTSSLAFCFILPGQPCGDPPVFPSARLDEDEMGQREKSQAELHYVCQDGHIMAGGARSFSLACDPQCGQWQGAVRPCVPEHVAIHLDYNVEEVGVTDWAAQLEATHGSQSPTPAEGLGPLNPLHETRAAEREVSFVAASNESEHGHLVELLQENMEYDKQEEEGEQKEEGSRRPPDFSLVTNSVGIKTGSRGLSTKVWENRRVTVTEEMPINVPWLRGERLPSATSEEGDKGTEVLPTYESPPNATQVNSHPYVAEVSSAMPVTTQDLRSDLVGFPIASTNAANLHPAPTDFTARSGNPPASLSPSPPPRTTAPRRGGTVALPEGGTRSTTSALATESEGGRRAKMKPVGSGRPGQGLPWPSAERAIEARTVQAGESGRASQTTPPPPPPPQACVGPLCALGGHQQQQRTLVVAAGAVVAVCALVALVVLGLWCLRKRQRSAECQLNGGKGQAAQSESVEMQRTV